VGTSLKIRQAQPGGESTNNDKSAFSTSVRWTGPCARRSHARRQSARSPARRIKAVGVDLRLRGRPGLSTLSRVRDSGRPSRCRRVSRISSERSSAFSYFTAKASWLATHCHLPLGIFVQVSVKRPLSSKVFPDASVPLAWKPAIATAVSPKA